MKKLNWHNPEHISEEHLNSRDGWRFLLPKELPPLPPCPAGWKYIPRGWGWKSEDTAHWICGDQDGWEVPEEAICIKQRTWENSNYFYVELVKDPHKPKQQPSSQWIKWSDRQPVEEDLPILCCVAGHTAYASYASSIPVGYTHWMHDDTPPVPPRELTQEEKDEAAADSAWMAISVGCEKSAFKAGYMAGISQGRLDNLSA